MLPSHHTQTVYAYLHTCHSENLLPPSVREIAQYCHLSLAATARTLDELEAQGCIQRTNGMARSIRPLKPPLTDADKVYSVMVKIAVHEGISLSIRGLRQQCKLSLTRIKAALVYLEKTGQVTRDPESIQRFYPCNIQG